MGVANAFGRIEVMIDGRRQGYHQHDVQVNEREEFERIVGNDEKGVVKRQYRKHGIHDIGGDDGRSSVYRTVFHLIPYQRENPHQQVKAAQYVI